MVNISVNTIALAIYNLCIQANTCLDMRIYSIIKKSFETATNDKQKCILSSIIQNAKIAYENKRPLCQDTGQVLVFLEIGQDVHFTDGNLIDSINGAVEKCYCKNFYRKSVVENSLFARNNTKTNTPVIIHTEIVEGENVKIDILIKGAGSENKSQAKMLLPTSTEKDIKTYIKKVILESGTSSCPPLFIGVGIGGTLDEACILSKKAFITPDKTIEAINFSNSLKEDINKNAPNDYNQSYVLGINLKTTKTHIACMPVAVTINCHSLRESSCIISKSKVEYLQKIPNFVDIKESKTDCVLKVNSITKEQIKTLKLGYKIEYSGEIIVARDMAHKKLIEMIKNKEQLPFQIKDSIIFYAGPCPAKENEIIGPIGPTTSSRMDDFAPILYDLGMVATIGKGERSQDVNNAIHRNNAIYFTIQGGIASLLASKIKKSEIVAFEDFGAEAIYKIEVENLPLEVSIV